MRHFLTVLAFVAAAVPAAAQRLTEKVVPEHYTLWFAPDLEKETFRGRETIRAIVTAPTTSITLHAAEIEYGDVRITSGGRTQTARVTTNAADETATFTVPQRIAEGPVSIEIAYTGILNDKLRGFYISRANGRKYAVTQMEATDGRRAFPSFDEPAFKATFDISLTIDRGDTAISNGRLVSDTPGPGAGKHTLVYSRTQKMSTYLVAMVVGDFVCREGSSDGTPIRVCSTPDKRELTGFALEAATHFLKFYNGYFGFKYPFGKLDVIGVPDFAAGAMENAGAITFREQVLLVDSARSSVAARKRVAVYLSHEIAHQWFGDLVTMKWWDDIWLNEGFASWMQNKAVAEWQPTWGAELDDFSYTESARALDALETARPLRTQVETPEEINEVFDSIAYGKTAALLRMIEAYVGPEAFRKGIASYVAKFAFKNASGEDFWTEVARATGRPVDRIFASFVNQPGVPLLTVRNACVNGTSEVSISQSRFISTPDTPSAASTWTLPACLKTGSARARCEVVDRPVMTVTPGACGPAFANADARGYYVTDYSPEEVTALSARARTLTSLERLNLVGDEWWMARSARHPIGVFLDLAASLADEDAPAVLTALSTRLAFTAANVVGRAQQPQFQRWVRERFGPTLATLRLPGNANDPSHLQGRRATLVTLVGITGGDAEVQKSARELAMRYLNDSASLDSTIAPAVLHVAAVKGDSALYDQYFARLGALSTQPEEYFLYFNVLPSFTDPALTQRTLTLAMSPAVRSQDTPALISQMLQLPWSRDAAWAFVKDHWGELVEKLGVFQGIPSIVKALAGLCTAAQAADVKSFFAKNPVEAVERGVRQAVEDIESCAKLNERQTPALADWLARRAPDAAR